MEHNVKLENISDGRLYDIEDEVRADAKGCNGCSACCHFVGDLVALTPYDIYEISKGLNKSAKTIISHYTQIQTKNKIGIPYLKMLTKEQQCIFLNEEKRCSIHDYRPNICRLFPLGRVYEKDSFKYFLQVNNCTKKELSKVKIREWLAIDRYEQNKEFILTWHNLLKALTFRLKFVRDEEELRQINFYVLETFYSIDSLQFEDFYIEFYNRLKGAKEYLGVI